MKKATITLLGHARDPELPVYGAKVLALRSGEIDIHVPRIHVHEQGASSVEQHATFPKVPAKPIGSEEMPFMKKATITLLGHARDPELPVYGAKVLALRSGEIDIHDIAPSGKSIKLESGMKYRKVAIFMKTPTYLAGRYFGAQVGLLSRNVLIRGKSYVKNCAIHKLFNRAITIHRTHELLVENNVIFDTLGSGIFLMDGVEESNILKHNLLVQIGAITTFTMADAFPASIHISNPYNILIDNVIAGGAYHGIR
ncbi:hypothetical protein AHF37_05105 [Paragonimus kellicotti]|nr:hypothetical protein AHF37_05105 [Paragonimus kellicotti]